MTLVFGVVNSNYLNADICKGQDSDVEATCCLWLESTRSFALRNLASKCKSTWYVGLHWCLPTIPTVPKILWKCHTYQSIPINMKLQTMQNEEQLYATTTVNHCDWAIKVVHISFTCNPRDHCIMCRLIIGTQSISSH